MVGDPIRLHTQTVNSRAFAPVQHPALNKGCIRRLAHFAPKGVDLPDKMPLGGAANGRIARHICNLIQGDGEHCGAASKPGRCQSGFHPRMPRTDHDHLIASQWFLHVFNSKL